MKVILKDGIIIIMAISYGKVRYLYTNLHPFTKVIDMKLFKLNGCVIET